MDGVEGLLRAWREKEHEWGQRYLEYVSSTPRDRVMLEDLTVTMLINSSVLARAAISIVRTEAHSISAAPLPAKTLEETTADEREMYFRALEPVTAAPP